MEEGETKAALNTTTQSESGTSIHKDTDDSCKRFIKPYQNGNINRLELLMSMASDLNRNIPVDNNIGDENSLGANSVADANTRNHASQLLMAAASVVGNGYVGNANGLRTVTTATAEVRNQDYTSLPINTCAVGTSYAKSTDQSLTSSTSVSFTSKPTMSTGFCDTSTLKQSKLEGLTIPSSVVSNISSSVLSQPNSDLSTNIRSDLNQDTSKLESHVVVPFLWKRVNSDGIIHYHSPSNEILRSMEKLKEYLLTEDTCKCGLPCPFHIDKMFSFDPSVISQHWKLSDIDMSVEKSARRCCHRKYIKSSALTKECENAAKPVKQQPSKRRVKPAAPKAGSKKAGGISRKLAQQLKSAEKVGGDSTASTAHAAIASTHSNTSTPIPPIETVMRSPLSLPYTPHNEPGFHSPRHVSDMVSPGMSLLSPHASVNQNSHMVPVIAHTGYPPSNGSLMPQQLYRHPGEAGFLSPSSQHPYYGLPHPHGTMPPYHPAGYDFMQSHTRHWNSPPPFPPMPPPGAQFAPPIWQARPDVAPRSDTASSVVRKRQRRASSRSSNGGNSDTGYTSGLSSPAHASPGQSKLQEKIDNVFKSKVHDERRQNSAADNVSTSRQTESLGSSTNHNITTNLSEGNGTNKTTGTVLPDISVLGLKSSLKSEHGFGSRFPLSNTAHNSIPSDGMQYMDPIYRARHIPHGYPHQLSPMYLSNRPHMYLPQTPQHSAAISSHMHESLLADTIDDKDGEQPTAKHSAKSKMDSKVHNTSTLSQGNVMNNHSPGIANSSQMLMNGFQPLFNQHMGASGMPYPHALANDYSYTARPSVHMMRAPTGSMFYRYAQPRMPVPPQFASYHPSNNSMYNQPPFISPTNAAPYNYAQPNTPPVSPKRKRRKVNSKTVIESHSAVLAETEMKQEKVTNEVPVEPSQTQAVNGSPSDK